jgi:ATP-dependent DNA helicase RecQ
MVPYFVKREGKPLKYNAQRALKLLRIGTGDFKATFRGNQEDAIRLLIAQRSKLLVIQKTGWGKSFVYFITAKLLREQGLAQFYSSRHYWL